jgi:hypothetical protein
VIKEVALERISEREWKIVREAVMRRKQPFTIFTIN